MNLLATPLGWIMKICYSLIHNYGIALLLFTLITRAVVLPLQIKQQKSMAKMSLIQPQLEKLKKKYGKNQEKLQEEQMKLYSESGVNPMASCLPLIITMVILFSMIPVIYGPLTYVSDLDDDSVDKSNTFITNIWTLSNDVKTNETSFEEIIKELNDGEIPEDGSEDWETVLDNFKTKITDTDEDSYSATIKAIDSDSEWDLVLEAIEKHYDIDTFITNADYVSQNLAKSRPELVTFDFVNKADGKYADVLPDDVRKEAEDFNYEVFGLSLGAIPSVKSALVIIPLLSFILQMASTIVSQYFNKKNNPATYNAGGMGMKVMLWIMPVFSLWIAFSYPAGLGLYWIYSSLFGLLQVIFLNIVYSPEKVKAMAEKEMEKQKEKRKKSGKKSFMERALEMQQQQDGIRKASSEIEDIEDDDEDDSDKKLSKAQIKDKQRKRLNEARSSIDDMYSDEEKNLTDEQREKLHEARRKMAELYGDDLDG